MSKIRDKCYGDVIEEEKQITPTSTTVPILRRHRRRRPTTATTKMTTGAAALVALFALLSSSSSSSPGGRRTPAAGCHALRRRTALLSIGRPTSSSFSSSSAAFVRRLPSSIVVPRGGALDDDDDLSDDPLRDAGAGDEKGQQQEKEETDGGDDTTRPCGKDPNKGRGKEPEKDEDGPVGQKVRPHKHHQHGKKSNAVGDPDGNSSDDDDDSESDTELSEGELEELLERAADLAAARAAAANAEAGGGGGANGDLTTSSTTAGMDVEVEIVPTAAAAGTTGVEVEYVEHHPSPENDDDDGASSSSDDEGEQRDNDEEDEDDEEEPSTAEAVVASKNRTRRGGGGLRNRIMRGAAGGGGGGGGGIATATTAVATSRGAARARLRSQDEELAKLESERRLLRQAKLDEALVEAFWPSLYVPPGRAALDQMRDDARHIDVAARRRLDRRTLYEGLMLELGGSGAGGGVEGAETKKKGSASATVASKKLAGSGSRRRYLDPPTSRALRSALSLASQPRWRRHLVMSSRVTDGGDGEVTAEDAEEEEEEEEEEEGSGGADDDDGEDEEEGEKEGRGGRGKRKRKGRRVRGGIANVVDDGKAAGWWRGGVRLYATEDEAALESAARESSSGWGSGGQQMGSFGSGMMPGGQPPPGMWGGGGGEGMGVGGDEEEGDGEESKAKEQLPSTMGMQETVAMAMAHSLSCGLALIDDVSLSTIRQTLLANEELSLSPDSPELRPAALLGHLIRLANEGRFNAFLNGSCAVKPESMEKEAEEGKTAGVRSGRISDRMERDMKLGLDDPNDELAVESLRLMKEDEKVWFESFDSPEKESNDVSEEVTGDAENNQKPLPLILFLRTDASPSILRSKSAVERLAKECVSDESIHLLMLGKGIDATTVSLPNTDSVGAAHNRMQQQQQQARGMQQGMMNPFMNSQQNAQMQNNPFAGLSSTPPGMMPNGNQQAGGPFAFGQQNINASGINDPEGSRRFNIFLARTVDPDGTPGIMGAIAPPQAGNLFPQMMATQARENMMKMQQQQEDGDQPTEEQRQEYMQRMAELMQQQMNSNNGMPLPPPQFFNASIASPFGMGGNPMGGENANGFQGMSPPPPEVVQQAIQQALTGVIDRLAQMNSEPDSSDDQDQNRLPTPLAKAFAQVLANEHLRRGIAENLARAAPALVDPRCQGIMLSVYVPPPPNHPNHGMMPGQQFQKGQGQGQGQGGKQSNRQAQRTPGDGSGTQKNAGGSANPMGGWLNKILSSANSGADKNAETSNEAGGSSSEAEDTISEAEVGQDGEESPSATSTEEKEDLSTEDAKESQTEVSRSKARNKRERRERVRNLAAAAAVLAANAKKTQKQQSQSGNGSTATAKPTPLTSEQKAQRNLSRLQALCRHIPLSSPSDPVRSRSWDTWAARERGAVIFRRNRRALNAELAHRRLRLKLDTGTKGVGSVLRQMMSVRDLTEEVEDVVKCAVEIEAARSQRLQESPWDHDDSKSGAAAAVDVSLEQLLVNDDGMRDERVTEEDGDVDSASEEAKIGKKSKRSLKIHSIHPSSIESALSLTCRVSPSPSGAASSSLPGSSSAQASHRSREDITALAQDKHERALVSQVVSPQDIGVTYDMIGGLNEVKELLRQSITYPLKYSHLYSEGIAREAVKGVLLFGPPGTGKTMLAKAVATEGGASFLSVDASSVENKWLGESEKNAKAVFTLARRLAPCVIFIDEVDSLLSSREGSSDDSAHGTLTSVKTTMMSEWDGLNSGTNGKGEAGSDRVVVIGSTNRPFDLDEAVLRRFPRRILVDLPDLETRQEILEVTMAENRLDPEVNFTQIAEMLEGYTGSDIKEVCREAVVQISHEQARMLDQGYLIDDEEDSGSAPGNSGGVAGLQRLRAVTMQDFENALSKLKRSVSETGRELARVWEWNDEYGEIKKKDKRDHLPQLMNMFL